MMQRKDYKVYAGSKFRIKRYYKLNKTIHGSDVAIKERIGSNGWMPIGTFDPLNVV
jgi:hypothetical protein